MPSRTPPALCNVPVYYRYCNASAPFLQEFQPAKVIFDCPAQRIRCTLLNLRGRRCSISSYRANGREGNRNGRRLQQSFKSRELHTNNIELYLQLRSGARCAPGTNLGSRHPGPLPHPSGRLGQGRACSRVGGRTLRGVPGGPILCPPHGLVASYCGGGPAVGVQLGRLQRRPRPQAHGLLPHRRCSRPPRQALECGRLSHIYLPTDRSPRTRAAMVGYLYHVHRRPDAGDRVGRPHSTSSSSWYILNAIKIYIRFQLLTTSPSTMSPKVSASPDHLYRVFMLNVGQKSHRLSDRYRKVNKPAIRNTSFSYVLLIGK